MAPIQTDNEDIVPRNGNNPTISFGEYLILRICQYNPLLKSIFGVPGDFNLNFLEYMYSESVTTKGVTFYGICNELNAGYAADAYSRVIKGLSVLITTYGVGELSAINAIAGSFAEFCPVLHIVGTTSTSQRAEAAEASISHEVRNIHHLVPNKNPLKAPDHRIYQHMIRDISVALEELTKEGFDDLSNFAKVDKVLSAICQESRPGYIFLPFDLPDIQVPVEFLSYPVKLQHFDESDISSVNLLNDLTEKIVAKLCNSKAPSVLADSMIRASGAEAEFTKFLSTLPSNLVKLFATNSGRCINEQSPNFVGTYLGSLSASRGIQESLEKETDFLFIVGYANIETNRPRDCWDLSEIKDQVVIHPDYVFIDNEYVPLKDFTKNKRSFSIGNLLSSISQALKSSSFIHNKPAVNNITYKFSPQGINSIDIKDSTPLTEMHLIHFFNSYLQPGDIVLVETCSFQFALADILFPEGVNLISQTSYESIGYGIPATLGACLANRDLSSNRRVVLIQGDGAAQMSIQELSSYLRYGVTPKIFLLNNSGYTVERIINGPTRSYNDINDKWLWTDLLRVFGDMDRAMHEASVVDTFSLLSDYMEHPPVPKIELVELRTDKLDAPARFAALCGKIPMGTPL